MGVLVSLDERRAARDARPGPVVRGAGGATAPASFCFDLGSPWTYLAAERVERQFVALEWRPVAGGNVADGRERETIERRAGELRLPVVWPERPGSGRGALRVAHLAAERGCAAAFVLATGRLAFCGGYDVDDPEILAEAAAAAGLGLEETLTAAGDRERDGELERDARALAACGADALPALWVGGRLFCGEQRIPEAVAAFADLRGTGRSRLVPTRGSR